MKNRIERAVRLLAAFFAVLLCLSALTDFYRSAWAEPSEELANFEEISVQMRVGSAGAAWEELTEGTKERPFVFAEEDEFVYCAQQRAPEGELEKYELRMVLDECLQFQSETAAVTDEEGEAVTELFDITKNGQQMIFAAKAGVSGEQIAGREFYFRVPVRAQSCIGERHLLSDGCGYEIVGGVNVFWRAAGGEDEWRAGEDVWIRGEKEAELMVEQQTVSDCRPGEIADWTVCVRQLREDSYAVGVTVEDAALPEGLTLLGMAASGDAEDIQLEKMGENGWKLACPRLEYGQTAVVVFQCRVDAGCPTGRLQNTVTARAKNFRDVKGETQRVAGDSSSVWINGSRPSDTADAPDR